MLAHVTQRHFSVMTSHMLQPLQLYVSSHAAEFLYFRFSCSPTYLPWTVTPRVTAYVNINIGLMVFAF